jgi:hypothetical protein
MFDVPTSPSSFQISSLIPAPALCFPNFCFWVPPTTRTAPVPTSGLTRFLTLKPDRRFP